MLGSERVRRLQQRGLSRIAEKFAIRPAPRVVVGGGHREEQREVVGVGSRVVRHHAALGRHADAVDAHQHPPHGHLVARERPRLVRADERRRAESLDCVQSPDDRVALGHSSHSE